MVCVRTTVSAGDSLCTSKLYESRELVGFGMHTTDDKIRSIVGILCLRASVSEKRDVNVQSRRKGILRAVRILLQLSQKLLLQDIRVDPRMSCAEASLRTSMARPPGPVP